MNVNAHQGICNCGGQVIIQNGEDELHRAVCMLHWIGEHFSTENKRVMTFQGTYPVRYKFIQQRKV